jgi:hypothetical protein
LMPGRAGVLVNDLVERAAGGESLECEEQRETEDRGGLAAKPMVQG